MKTKIVLGVSLLSLLLFAGAGYAKQKLGPPVKLVLSPGSRVPAADIMKNLQDKCPNVSLTLNSKESDYMLDARWYPQEYRFMLLSKPHGDAVFATRTVLLSNAVKDVCKYINNNPPPPPPAK
jgi:hypothetical protein